MSQKQHTLHGRLPRRGQGLLRDARHCNPQVRPACAPPADARATGLSDELPLQVIHATLRFRARRLEKLAAVAGEGGRIGSRVTVERFTRMDSGDEGARGGGVERAWWAVVKDNLEVCEIDPIPNRPTYLTPERTQGRLWLQPIFHQFCASRGYAALSVNFRGSTDFGKRHLNLGNGQWGATMHEDLLGMSWVWECGDTIQWATSQALPTSIALLSMAVAMAGTLPLPVCFFSSVLSRSFPTPLSSVQPSDAPPLDLGLLGGRRSFGG
ncbi:hypothetical protein BC938DRAFT_478994 [Jimgerdemannia flammicorona]|uniref:Peptidase S9 prolyl oligopeptidase catalytic domain-containing protein n=1 Tax=Jimgerdemannia flammicorona TaxID=994334 RepID=A0A433QY16_9FUNG|nr:hypothetical protein BC938DRAFT_478994 [Jimgerdemannia flammicorona]